MAHFVAHAIGLGASPSTAANNLAVIGGLHIVGTLAIGRFADRAGTKPSMMITFMLTAVILLWLVMASELWMLYLFAIIYCLAYGGLSILFSPMTAELFGLRSQGVIFGIVSFFGTIGNTTGPFLAGRIFDVTNSYQLAFFVCIVVSLLGLVLAWRVKPTSQKITPSASS
jgi:MFS family permease